MNNNRGNSRRRGRGGNRQQGHQQLNRIDSRARGNAPQLLDKYKKLAHDAHLNGDRVQEEYYLQFADHYFRVIADQKQRQEEARQRRDERSQDNAEGGREEDGSQSDSERSDGEDKRQGEGAARDDSSEGEDGQLYEPQENPFVRESRSPRGTRQRKPRRSSRGDDGAVEAQDDGEQPDSTAGVDPSVLPPAISSKSDGDEAGDKAESADAEEAKPRRRTRRKRPEDDAGEPLQAVN